MERPKPIGLLGKLAAAHQEANELTGLINHDLPPLMAEEMLLIDIWSRVHELTREQQYDLFEYIWRLISKRRVWYSPYFKPDHHV